MSKKTLDDTKGGLVYIRDCGVHDPVPRLTKTSQPEHVHGPWIVVEWEPVRVDLREQYGIDVTPTPTGGFKATTVACSSCLEHKGLASARPDVRTETK